MYYLQSRYYDPSVGRFVNSDEIICSVIMNKPLQYNSFSYCYNNMVNNTDYLGYIGTADAAMFFVATNNVAVSSISWSALITKLAAFLSVIAPYLVVTVVVIAGIALIAYASSKGKTKIPSNLKSGNKIKTPNSNGGEFNKKKGGSYKHKKTGWEFRKSKDGHYNGAEHWHASPPNRKTGNYYNITPDGRIL